MKTGGTKLKDFLATTKEDNFQSEIAKLRHDVEEFAKHFPTIGFEKETMKYKDWFDKDLNGQGMGTKNMFNYLKNDWSHWIPVSPIHNQM